MILLKMSKQRFRVKIERDIMVPMRDGTQLCTDVYRPDTMGSFPAVVYRTPYDKSRDDTHAISCTFAQHGYLAITQDIRGWFASEGEKDVTDETEDGYDTIEWAATLSDCSGKVGMWGYSYPCITALAAATAQPPHLNCLFVGGIPGQGTEDPSVGATGNPTGIVEVGRRLLWLLDQGAEDRKRLSKGWQRGPITREAAEHVFFDIDRHKWLWTVPLTNIPDHVFGGLKWKWLQQLRGTYQGICRQGGEEKGGDPHRLTIPIYWIDGWYDRLHGDFYLFTETTTKGASNHARRNQKLVVGPWGHGTPWNFKPTFGDIDFGPEAELGSPWDVMGPWFDYWLKGIDTGIMSKPKVRLFVLGANTWRYEDTWPPERAVMTDFYLHSQGHANTAYGDGTIDANPPGNEPPDVYVYDARDPVMSIDIPREHEAPYDLRPNNHRHDLLVYSSKPLTQDVEVTGQPQTTFWATSSARDTDFMVRLSDVYPNGLVLWHSYGIVRASRLVDGRTYKDAKPIEPGNLYHYSFTMRVMCNLFRAGHRIRVDVKSSHFPKFDRNHNTGKLEYWGDSELLKATQTIYHDDEHPFTVTLPIIP
jgi:putative CocE/NonD family hydrolase